MHSELITIKNIQEELNVSAATVKNWIKLGYLEAFNNEVIDKKSYNKFLSEYVGKIKLTARANKLHKLTNENILKEQFIQYLNKNIPAEELSKHYENILSESHKNKEGIFYTPLDIIDKMLEWTGDENLNKKTFLDPSCGTGNFLIQAIKKGFHPENIYGFDTDPIAVEIAKKRIFELTGYKTNHIFNFDFLEYTLNNHTLFSNKSDIKLPYFDFIYTNPPWGKKLLPHIKKLYAQKLNAGNATDTYALFLLASFMLLKDNGQLGFLLPESFFNVSAYESLRNHILQYNIESILNFGKGFKELMTTTQAIILNKNKQNNFEKIKIIHYTKNDLNNYSRNKNDFNKNPKRIFNFWITGEEQKIIEKIFSFNHITLKNNAVWGMGIVTGNNRGFCKPQKINDNYIPVWKGEDITLHGLKQPSLFIDKDLSKYQQTAPKEYYEAKEKIIYRFITPRLCFYLDDKQRYILNSANFFILKENFPVNSIELVKYLNSNIINHLFQSLFKTHKILRSDLEEIPIITDYFEQYKIFNEETFKHFLGLIK